MSQTPIAESKIQRRKSKISKAGRLIRKQKSKMQNRQRREYTVSDKVLAANRCNLEKARRVPAEIRARPTEDRRAASRANLQKARAAPRTEKQLAAARANLVKARAAPRQKRYRGTPKRLAACHASLLKAHAVQRASDAPSYAPNLRQGLYCIDLRRSAAALGESLGELDRLCERLGRALPAANDAARRGVRSLAEGMWRRRRVFGGRAHLEAVRFYAWLGEAARRSITGIEQMGELARKVSDLFEDEWSEQLPADFKRTCLHLERLVEAYTEAATGRHPHLGWFLVEHRRLAAWLEARPEAVGNPFVGRQKVERSLSRGRTTLKDPKRWAWKVKPKDDGEREESDGVPYGLIREWEGQGFRVPDPRRVEDFELHRRLVEAALGMGDFQWPADDSGSSGDAHTTGYEQSSVGPARRGQSSIQSPELRDAVRQLAEVTWERLRVFVVQAEEEWRRMEERLEGLLAGTLRPPQPEPHPWDQLRERLGKPPLRRGPSYEQWAAEQVVEPLLFVEEDQLWNQARELAARVGGALESVIMALEE